MYFSTNIKYLRKIAGLTQEVLADILNTTRARVESYENGRSSPPVAFLLTYSEAFGISIDELIKTNITSLGQEQKYYDDKLRKVTLSIYEYKIKNYSSRQPAL